MRMKTIIRRLEKNAVAFSDIGDEKRAAACQAVLKVICDNGYDKLKVNFFEKVVDIPSE